MKFSNLNKLLIAVALGVIFAFLFVFRVDIKNAARGIFAPALPQPKTITEFTGGAPRNNNAVAVVSRKPSLSKVGQTQPREFAQNSAQNPSVMEPQKLPDSINLDIPFASQAPHSNWDMPYQEACEEAAVIMSHYFLQNKKNLDADTMDRELLALIDWEEKNFGYYKDTTGEEVARMLREYFNYKNVEVLYEFIIEDIKQEVADGNPVILLAAGRLLPNPNFKEPGPIYHALVVKGYTKNKIITNDPGTRLGKNFLYDPVALFNAIHDWNPVNILEGRKVMVVVK